MGRRLIYIKPAATPAYLPLTTAWKAATLETDTTILNALNTFEAGLIANSLTGKFNALYPFVGGNSFKHSFNFINTLTFQLTFMGGGTHDANGYTPSVNGYAITGIIPNTHLLKDDNHLSMYTGITSNANSDIGAFTLATPPTRVLELDTRTSGLFRYFGNDATTLQVATADNKGWSLGTRTGSTTKTIYKNGVSVATNSVASVGLPLVGIYLGTRNVDGAPSVPSSAARHQFDSIGSGLTAGEASTLYTLIQAMQTSLSRPAYNPLTTAWKAATSETDTTILNALNTFEQGLIDNGLTGKFNAIYPFVGGNSFKHSFNFINTLTFQLTFFGGWTHSATGALPAFGSYANTGLTPSTTLSLNDAHLSVYTRTNTNGGVDIGSSVTFPTRHCYLTARSAGNFIGNINQATNSLVANANSQGWFTTSRTGVTTLTGYKNGTSILASVDVSTAMSTQPIWLAARNLNGSVDNGTTRQQAFASIGSGLTAGEVSTLYTLIQAFQTNLNTTPPRQV